MHSVSPPIHHQRLISCKLSLRFGLHLQVFYWFALHTGNVKSSTAEKRLIPPQRTSIRHFQFHSDNKPCPCIVTLSHEKLWHHTVITQHVERCNRCSSAHRQEMAEKRPREISNKWWKKKTHNHLFNIHSTLCQMLQKPQSNSPAHLVIHPQQCSRRCASVLGVEDSLTSHHIGQVVGQLLRLTGFLILPPDLKTSLKNSRDFLCISVCVYIYIYGRPHLFI